MAKRKRLTVPNGLVDSILPEPSEVPAGQPTDISSSNPLGSRPALPRAPIAQVAGEAAAQSALDVLAQEMALARRDGRLIQALPLEAIEARHQVRDRMVVDPVEMTALKTSLQSRGQQTPIEVVEIEVGRYGLISGYRRLLALRCLFEETNAPEFATVQALIKPIDSVSDSYVAMVEENEIRANLSYYERAHLACEAARMGVYTDTTQAVQTLFASASSAKRSKILAFARLHLALGAQLRFPAAIPERLGLALTSALEADAAFGHRLKDALRKSSADSPEKERALLDRSLKKKGSSAKPMTGAEVAAGIYLETSRERVTLRGEGVTEALRADLQRWLAAR